MSDIEEQIPIVGNNAVLDKLSKEDLKVMVESLMEVQRRSSRNIPAGKVRCNYYDAKYAKQLIPMLDSYQRDRKPIIFRYTKYRMINKRTLYIRLYYSLKYIQAGVDANFIQYHELAKGLSVEQDRSGVYVGPPRSGDSVMLDFEKYDPIAHSTVVDWALKVRDFLSTAEIGHQLYLDHLALTDEDVQWVEQQVADADSIICSVSHSMIKLVKLDPTDYAQLDPSLPSD